MSFIRTFFAWGAETKRRYCEKLDIFIDAISSPRDKFTVADLQKIFTVLPTLAAKPWQFWVPLIQLYTGARIGEPSALTVDHFRNEAGIEVMHLPGTKSDSAVRDIPIHPDLIKIGLIEFVEMRRKKGCATLFDLSISEQNGAGAAVTKFFF